MEDKATHRVVPCSRVCCPSLESHLFLLWKKARTRLRSLSMVLAPVPLQLKHKAPAV
jgi:hypothetical protein